MPSIVYLDTNHLSFLGKHSDSAGAIEFLNVIDRSGASIALSIVHLIELGNPGFKSSPNVASVLDALPVVWTLPPDTLWEREVHAAYAALADVREPVNPFGPHVSTAIGGTLKDVPPSLAIETFRDPELRREIDRATFAGIMFDAMKKDASLIRDPFKLLKRMIAQRNPGISRGGVVLPPIQPDQVFEAVGGIQGFPSYGLMHAVATARLKDKTFRASRSDVYDLIHVGYAPYASFTALDRSYTSRVRQARPALVSRVTSALDEMAGWISADNSLTIG